MHSLFSTSSLLTIASRKGWRNREEQARVEQAAERVAVPIPEISEADRQSFLGLSAWTFRYVNHVYANAGYGERPLRKIWNEAVYWQNDGWHAQDADSERLFVTAKGLFRRLAYQSSFDPEVRSEYERQSRLGTEIKVEKTTYPYPREQAVVEGLKLEFDADETIIGGAYRWYGSRPTDQPAPTGEFSDAVQAHELGASGRGAFLLGAFRDFALGDGVERGFDTALGVGNRSAVRVPEALIPIPSLV